MSRRPPRIDWADAAIAASVLLIAAASVALSMSALADVRFEQTNAGSVD